MDVINVASTLDDEDEEYEYNYQRLDSVSEENNYSGIDNEDDFWGEIKVWWNICWPTMTLFGISQAYSLTDYAFLGHFGEKSSTYLAAASQSGLIIELCLAIFTRGTLQVLTVLCSQAYGAEKFSLMGQWLQICLVFCFIGAFFCFGLIWNASHILDWIFDLDDEVLQHITIFSHWSCLRLIPQLFAASLRQFCLAQKILLPLLMISMFGVLLNVGLNQLFIHTIDLGFKGSPIATASTTMVVLLLTFSFVFIYSPGEINKSWTGWSKTSFQRKKLKEFFKQAIPLTIGTCLEEFQIQTISSFAIKISKKYPDGSWIIGTHDGLLTLFLAILAFQWGVMKSTSVRVGHHIGSGKPKRAKIVVKIALIVSTSVSFISGLILFFCRHFVGHVFSNDKRIIDEVSRLILPLSFGYIALSFFYISMAVLEALSKPKLIAGSFLLGSWIVGVPLCYLLGVHYDLDLLGLWLGLMAGYCVVTICLVSGVLTADWEKAVIDARVRNELGTTPNQSPASTTIISIDTNTFPSPSIPF